MRASYKTADKHPLNMSKELERGARDKRTRTLKRRTETEREARKWTRRSFGALDPQLSDEMRFSYFFRTVPNELTQCAGIAQLLNYFGWSWVGILATDDDSGERAVRELKAAISRYGGCVEFTFMIPGNETMKSLDSFDYDASNFRFTYSMYTAVYALAHALHDMLFSDSRPEIITNGSLHMEIRHWKVIFVVR
ncbi:hypothetical protein NDU88_000480 [Pleurodeles waltl]|uniref:Receptor ligand binding region domain-containing protein n=1 Tax=Pleurodeles waltl TaxID=8319 RepID=A0AAV7WJM6_PLEWA|nr:hypothetical protein NDU88_000480 [Pleurodeles waltl]